MTENFNAVDEHFKKIVKNIDQNYESWANKNKEKFPQLFCDSQLSPAFLHAARIGLTILQYSVEDCWSIAGSLLGRSFASDNEKSMWNLQHLMSLSGLPSEIMQSSILSSRILVYKSIASERATNAKKCSINDQDMCDAFLQTFCVEGSIYNSEDTLVSALITNKMTSVYTPLMIRNDVYTKLLSTLFKDLEHIENTDIIIKLIYDVQVEILSIVAPHALSTMAQLSPCQKSLSCDIHQYFHEHSVIA